MCHIKKITHRCPCRFEERECQLGSIDEIDCPDGFVVEHTHYDELCPRCAREQHEAHHHRRNGGGGDGPSGPGRRSYLHWLLRSHHGCSGHEKYDRWGAGKKSPSQHICGTIYCFALPGQIGDGLHLFHAQEDIQDIPRTDSGNASQSSPDQAAEGTTKTADEQSVQANDGEGEHDRSESAESDEDEHKEDNVEEDRLALLDWMLWRGDWWW